MLPSNLRWKGFADQAFHPLPNVCILHTQARSFCVWAQPLQSKRKIKHEFPLWRVCLGLAVAPSRCDAACNRMLAMGSKVEECLVSLVRGNAPTNVAVLAAKWSVELSMHLLLSCCGYGAAPRAQSQPSERCSHAYRGPSTVCTWLQFFALVHEDRTPPRTPLRSSTAGAHGAAKLDQMPGDRHQGMHAEWPSRRWRALAVML